MAEDHVKMTPKEIVELMDLKGWSQAKLASKMQVTDGALTKWLTGVNPLPGPVVVLLREWLDAARAKAAKRKQPA